MRKKKVDVLTRLEALSKDESLPQAVREDAGRELIRLSLKDKPPAKPAAPTSAPIVADFAGVFAALEAREKEIAAKVEQDPTVVPSRPEPTESEQWAIDKPERERKARDAKYERERVEKLRQAEMNRPETVEEFQARRAREQRAASEAWAAAMGVSQNEMYGDWRGQ